VARRSLTKRDASRLDEIRDRLGAFAVEPAERGPAPAWLVAGLAELLECPRFIVYRPERDETMAWHLGEPASTDGAFFSTYSTRMRASASPLLYNPLRPESHQQNRVHLLRDIHIHGPGATCIIEEAWPELGIGGHDQLRALICEGPTLLAWVGGVRGEPFAERERDMLAALVEPLRQSLALRRRLLDTEMMAAGFTVALNALGAPAFVARQNGVVLHASTSGAAMIDRLGARVSGLIRSALAGGTDGTFTGRLNVPGLPECFLVVLRDVDRSLDARLAEARRRWRLTRRETETLKEIVSGKGNKEIAVTLDVHLGSVERHVTSIFRKSRSESRTQLVVSFWTMV
jgi:DNA-binding CsgD family transcriptional regulator